MKQNDVKVGDWVTLNGEIATVMQCEVLCCTLDYGDESVDYISYSELEPIPLEGKMLEWSEWTKDKKKEGKYYHPTIPISAKRYMYYWSIDADMGVNTIRLTTIKYVHELQHILWALGTDDKVAQWKPAKTKKRK